MKYIYNNKKMAFLLQIAAFGVFILLFPNQGNALSKKIEIGSPGNNDILVEGTNFEITWGVQLISPQSYNIHYYPASREDLIGKIPEGSSVAPSFIAEIIGGSEYSYYWKIPESIESEWKKLDPDIDFRRGKIRIEARQGDQIYKGDSRGIFRLVEAADSKVKVISPNGGETVKAGEKISVKWESKIMNGKVVIDLWKGERRLTTLNLFTRDDGEQKVIIPNYITSGSDYKIRIKHYGSNKDYDDSDSFFKVEGGAFANPYPDSVVVLSPNGGSGDVAYEGKSHRIQWKKGNSNSVFKKYIINYYPIENPGLIGKIPEGSVSAPSFIAEITNPNQFSFLWNVPEGIESEWLKLDPNLNWRIGKIRVEAVRNDGSRVSDDSDKPFKIATSSKITIISPNGGETVKAGEKINVSWNSELSGGKVSIQLWKANEFYENLKIYIGNDGSEEVKISRNFPVADNYKIKVLRYSDFDEYDFSDAYFSIIK